MEEGEKETCRDIDDPVSRHSGSPWSPFHSMFGISQFGISQCRASLYVHVPACMHGRQDWGGGGVLKSLAEKGISCGEKGGGGGGRKRAGPLTPH